MYRSDYHLHTLISSDSPASLEQQARAALKAGLNELCVTDHWNLLDQTANPLPRTRDWAKSISQCRQAQEIFGSRLEILLGIEVGNGEIDPDSVSAGLSRAGEALDFVIGSLHNQSLGSGGLGIFTAAHRCQQIEEGIALLDDYVDTLIALADTDTFDVLGHVIYPLRYLPEKWQLNLDPYEEQLRQLFTKLVQTGRGIEVNTTQGNTVTDWIPVLELYRECGGEILITGSDAHRPEFVGAAFSDTYALLKKSRFPVGLHLPEPEAGVSQPGQSITPLLSKKYGKETKMELVFAGSIFYNIVILNKLGVVCHAGFRQAEYSSVHAGALPRILLRRPLHGVRNR